MLSDSLGIGYRVWVSGKWYIRFRVEKLGRPSKGEEVEGAERLA